MLCSSPTRPPRGVERPRTGQERQHITTRIADHALLSDCHTAALVTRAGSVDWWCVPRFDSPSVFGRLLDPAAGHWSVRPAEEAGAPEPGAPERSYVGESLALRTVWRSAQGAVSVTDVLALEPGARGHDIGLRSPHVLVRLVEGLEGEVRMVTEFAPRFEYGLTTPRLSAADGGIMAHGGPVTLRLTAPVSLLVDGGHATSEFTVAAGGSVAFSLRAGATYGAGPTTEIDGTAAVADAVAAWESWASLHRGYEGRYREQVRRSAMVLQGLTFAPSGAVVAAATTSLPEELGGALNWDYRFAWLRDLSLTLQAQWVASCPTEAQRFFGWVADAMGQVGERSVQIMYGVGGERDLTEHTVGHLQGFAGSQPVRVGNDAWDQHQLDVLGEVLYAAHLLREQLGELDATTRDLLVALADQARRRWREPDAGMWEARDETRHYVSSKVMCWVALDRAVRLSDRLGPDVDAQGWAMARDEVRAAVLDQAWSEAAGAYTGAFGSDQLDASVLLLPLVGFLPADDERMLATIHAIEAGLATDGLVKRWATTPPGS